MQANLINKIPSYSVVWHKEYILSPSCDLVIGLNFIWCWLKNCSAIALFPPNNKWFVYTVLYSGRHLSIAFFSFHSVFLSHGKLWVLLVICQSWFDVQYLFLRYWINPRCAILNLLPCNHSKKQKFLGKNWLHVSRVKKSLLYCLSSDRRFFESFRWSRKFWIENPKPS